MLVSLVGLLLSLLGRRWRAGFAKMFIITFPAFEGWNIPLSIGLVIMLSLMNIAGLKTSKVLTITATIAKLIPIVAFSVITIFFLKQGMPNFTPFTQLEQGQSLFSAVSKTAVYIFYGFIGFETLSIVAGEMRNPEKNVPRAILGSISIVSVLYMLIIGGTIAMLGSGIMSTDAPVQDAFVKMIGPAGAWLVSIGALISITGLNMGESIMVPRYGARYCKRRIASSKNC
ncbi:APC family permease [Streptococcus iniae]